MPGDRILVDTNVFVYAADTSSPYFQAASEFLDAVAAGRFSGCVAPQILLEFVSVVTSPKRVATVRSTGEAWAVADAIAASYTVLVPPEDLYAQASALGRSLGLARQDVFDLAIGITALHAGISTVWTFDTSVFSRVPGIAVHTPDAESAKAPDKP